MPTLADALTRPETRPKVVKACCDLVATEVDAKGGFTGLAIKGGYKLVQAIKPGVVAEIVDRMLPEFATALDALYQESVQAATESQRPRSEVFERYVTERSDAAAEALLSVTDARARRVQSGALKRTYERLRGTAGEHVRAAVPGLARTLSPFV